MSPMDRQARQGCAGVVLAILLSIPLWIVIIALIIALLRS